MPWYIMLGHCRPGTGLCVGIPRLRAQLTRHPVSHHQGPAAEEKTKPVRYYDGLLSLQEHVWQLGLFSF
jgi:hypothetical protein